MMPRLRNRFTVVVFFAIGVTGLLGWSLGRPILQAVQAADKPEKSGDSKEVSQTALEEFNSLIGEWRGVGQPKRFSNNGAWTEKAEWVWDFKENGVAIRYDMSNSKLLKSARLTYDPKEKLYRLQAVTPNDAKRSYAGKLDEDKLVLESTPDKDDLVYRMTVRRLNDKRTIVLHEMRRATSDLYARIAEVGYTREGTRLAETDSSGPVCIVTGGVGTSKVTYKGMSYWVCCEGCRQAFEEDPEGIIAAARERAEKKKRESERTKGSS